MDFEIHLNLKIHQNNTDVYYKDTHAGQFINYHSQTPRKLRPSWIKSLYHRAHKICSTKQSLNKKCLLNSKFRYQTTRDK